VKRLAVLALELTIAAPAAGDVRTLGRFETLTPLAPE
jgi:hypothetical protein